MHQYFAEQEIAQITGMAIQTLRNWRHQKKGFPYVKIGRSVRYDLKEVMEFMRRHTIKPEDREGIS